jgi:hypothetical protein
MVAKTGILTPEIREQCKDELKAMEDAAFERGKVEGMEKAGSDLAAAHANLIAEAKNEAAKLERERIQAVEAACLAGHETLINQLKFDGKTTGPEAAQAVLAAEKTLRAARLKNIKQDAAEAVVPDAVAPDPARVADAEANLPLAERAKKTWEAKPEIREEFTSQAAYTAFLEAEAKGQVRILSRKAQ